MSCRDCGQQRGMTVGVFAQLPAAVRDAVRAREGTRPIPVSRLIEEARLWLGSPFHHQGRSHGGVDCVGLPIVVAKSLNLIPSRYDTENYSRLPTGEIVPRVRELCTQIPVAIPGSIIVIAWTTVAAHMALCTGPSLIHAYETLGKVVEHGYRGRWLRITHSAWAVPGVRYE